MNKVLKYNLTKLYGAVFWPTILFIILGFSPIYPIQYGRILVYIVLSYLIFIILMFKGKILTTRLNPYFIVHAMPFNKHKIISQMVERSHIKGMCYSKTAKDLVSNSILIIDKLPSGYYSTITHGIILRRIKKRLTYKYRKKFRWDIALCG